MKNIEKGNKLIAEFMGGKTEMLEQPWKNTPDVEAFYDVEKIPDLISPLTSKRLRYHKSWDWLMPVVEKIESLNVSTEIAKRIGHGEYHITTFLTSDNIINIICFKKTKIESVYKAVIKFIEKYNNENRSE